MTVLKPSMLAFALTLAAAATAALAEPPAVEAPTLFAPGSVSGPGNDWTPTFTPDGKTLYFTRSGPAWGFILESHAQGGGWSAPVIAPFSGEYPDSSATLAPDGSYIVFESLRPATPALAAELKARHQGLSVSAIWKSTRTATGWGAPERLPDTVNISTHIWKPSVAADGTVYFISKHDGDKNFRLYRSRYRDGRYAPAEPLSFSDGKTLDVDPAVSADGSYLVFSSAGRGPRKDDHEHLYIVFAQGAGWGPVIPLCYPGDDKGSYSFDDDAVIGPDGTTLYYATDRALPVPLPKSRAEAEQAAKDMQGWNNGNANVWSLSLKPWLDAARTHTPMPACTA